MKILFEEYGYKTEDVKDILGSFLLKGLDLDKATQSLRYVGYFFNKDIVNSDGSMGDLVFILPKVLLDENNQAFGVKPESVLHFNYKEWKNDELLVPDGKLNKLQVYNFIYGFATWIYRAVDIYRKNLRSKNKDEDDAEAEVMTSVQIGQSGKKENTTMMDILLSMLDFQRTHRNFITFVIKMAHSGFNKISWPKTIARTQAVIQDGCPIYLNPVNKTRAINFDEELLIIYYSILNYIHEEYGFPIPNQPGYKLIKGAMFKSYMKSQGRTRLHKIRYKYYSDDAILLWNLCYAFFEKADHTGARANRKDYLLVNKFETVFEGMIDELIGDKNLPEGLKRGRDDKRIDHLYTYKYLLENLDDESDIPMAQDIYHIADSKYYGRNKELRGHDVPKQFTYARNVIQWHMDILHYVFGKDNEAEKYRDIPLFDKVTEGYNIIPNFFISSFVDDSLSYEKSGFGRSTLGGSPAEKDEEIKWVVDQNMHESYFFWERLFDRNTYFTLHYDVNFLYVLKMYAQNKSYNKVAWKNEVRKLFREGMLDFLNEEFKFYQIIVPENKINDFVEKHYRRIVGKVFSFPVDGAGHVLIYAERKNQDKGKGESYKFNGATDPHISNDGKSLVIPNGSNEAKYRINKISSLGKDTYMDTRRLLFLANTEYQINGTEIIPVVNVKDELGEVKNSEEYALIGYVKDETQMEWIRRTGKYNIPATFKRPTIQKESSAINAKYLILHNENLGKFVYKITSVLPCFMKREELHDLGYPGSSKKHDYLVYDIDLNATVDESLTALIHSKRFESKTTSKAARGFTLKHLFNHAKKVTLYQLRYDLDQEYIFNSLVAEDDVDSYNVKKK